MSSFLPICLIWAAMLANKMIRITEQGSSVVILVVLLQMGTMLVFILH